MYAIEKIKTVLHYNEPTQSDKYKLVTWVIVPGRIYNNSTEKYETIQTVYKFLGKDKTKFLKHFENELTVGIKDFNGFKINQIKMDIINYIIMMNTMCQIRKN